jgi:hypothetical protein
MKYERQHQIRLKYRFHLIDKYGEMVFRYDNAPHHDIATFPHHKHIRSTIAELKEEGLLDVLSEVEVLISECGEPLNKRITPIVPKAKFLSIGFRLIDRLHAFVHLW